LKEEIFSKEIILKYRNSKTDFTRNRKQPFGQMLLFMFNLVKKSLVIEIDNFVQFLNSKTDSAEIKNFTKSAFVQKRMKINPEVFKHLSEVIVENTYVENNATIKLFEGFRLLAVDGSKVTLPYTEDLKKEFGESKNNTNTSVVQGRTSILYDVLNHIALDSVLANLGIGERELAIKHKFRWKKRDLIIYDRGCSSYDFKYEHIKEDVNFAIRANITHSKAVSSFVSSGKKSLVVDIFPQERHCFKDKPYNKETSIEVRLVRVNLLNGEIEVLMTSLLDSQKHPSKMFKELYFLRWGIETYYDELKNKIKLEYFTGYSKISVLQDFFCAVFISNLQSTIVNDLQEELAVKIQNTKLDYKINTNLTYGFLKNRFLELLFNEGALEDVFLELQTLFLKNTVTIRPGRSNHRNVGKYRNRIRPLVFKNQRDAV
jgi:Transposase DDE domain